MIPGRSVPDSSEREKIMESILEKLGRFVPLKDVRAERRSDIAKRCQLEHHSAGEYLFGVGDKAQSALFLVSGSLRFEDQQGVELARLKAGDSKARYRLAHQSPRRVAARCISAVECLCVDAHMLDVLLTWDQSDQLEVSELTASQGPTDDWMLSLLSASAFQQLPPTNLQALFQRMQPMPVRQGQLIIRQDEPGDYFYVIAQGVCQVVREMPQHKPLKLSELSAGSYFGEEALLTDAGRSATISMLSDGVLMRLAKRDFVELLREPLIRQINPLQARRQIETGELRLLDVRLLSEFQASHLPHSLHIPLYMLRARLNQLDPQQPYLCICDSGRRSAVAAFVLNSRHHSAYSLKGGLETLEN